MRPHFATHRRRAVRELAILAGAFLLVLLALWATNPQRADASHNPTCEGGYHKHNAHTCHKHCQNGMRAHNTNHGDNCAGNDKKPAALRITDQASR